MDIDTINRAYEIICDMPGITRGQLAVAMGISNPSATRYIATLRDVEKRIIRQAGFGYRPADQLAQVAHQEAQVAHQEAQHRNLKDLATGSASGSSGSTGGSTPSSKGLRSNLSQLSQFNEFLSGWLNSISNSIYIKRVRASMEDEEQASSYQDAENNKNNMQVEVDALARSTVTGNEEQNNQVSDMNDYVEPTIPSNNNLTNMNADVGLLPPIPSQLDVMESVRSLLSSSIEKIKSGNQSNGYKVGRGWKKSMERKQWEHLQYAYNYLVRPQAGVYDLLMALQCLRHSEVNYEAQPIPWDKIHAECPAPPARAIKPILHPGPPEGWVDIDPEWEEIWRSHLADTTEPVAVDHTEPDADAEYEWPEPPRTHPACTSTVTNSWAAAVAAATPYVHEDMATMRARHEREQQAECDEIHAAVAARLDLEIAQELAEAAEVPATPAPLPEAHTEAAWLTPAAELDRRITRHIQQGVSDPVALAKACGSSYDRVKRAAKELEKQNIIRNIDGGWQMVTPVPVANLTTGIRGQSDHAFSTETFKREESTIASQHPAETAPVSESLEVAEQLQMGAASQEPPIEMPTTEPSIDKKGSVECASTTSKEEDLASVSLVGSPTSKGTSGQIEHLEHVQATRSWFGLQYVPALESQHFEFGEESEERQEDALKASVVETQQGERSVGPESGGETMSKPLPLSQDTPDRLEAAQFVGDALHAAPPREEPRMEAPEAISEVGEPVAAVMPAECVTLDQKVYWHVSNGLGRPAGIAEAIAATTGDVLMSLMTLAYFGKVEKDPEDYTRLWRVA